MIVVNNTKELEQRFNLSTIPDGEMIQVLGGTAGKQKYSAEKYQRRVTYPARQLKQIIMEMNEIEKEIPANWNDWQKAKYIYEVLADNIDYNLNKQDYSTQQCSNLTVLLSKKGICAGYSLLYKEMMDRQGIPCDYMRGTAITSRGETGKHAWNILNIDGNAIGVDLTWDSEARRNGEEGLRYFGDDSNFLYHHRADSDERQYNLATYAKETIDSISTTPPQKNIEYTKDQKLAAISFAIGTTYKKFKEQYGEKTAIEQVNKAIKNYIREGKATGFTRDNFARSMITDNIQPEEMKELIIDSYIEQSKNSQMPKDSLEYSVRTNLYKYDAGHAKFALDRFITSGDETAFTRDGDARGIIKSMYTPETALTATISSVVSREIQAEKNMDFAKDQNIKIMREQYKIGDEFAMSARPNENVDIMQNQNKQYFYGNELAQVEPPKDKGLFSKALSWIKDKFRLRQTQKDIGQEQNQKQPEDYQR